MAEGFDKAEVVVVEVEVRAVRADEQRRWVAPSDSTLCRVMADTDPDALQEVLLKWAAPRLAQASDLPALAADGKRIRGANRHTRDATYFETVTLVTHAGRPVASQCCRDEGGEVAALRALLEDVDVRGCVLTLDALHTTRDTARSIVDRSISTAPRIGARLTGDSVEAITEGQGNSAISSDVPKCNSTDSRVINSPANSGLIRFRKKSLNPVTTC